MFASTSLRTRLSRAVLGAAALASIASASLARADHTREHAAASYGATQKTDVMSAMDADKNGYVTREEFIKFQETVFDQVDRNKDRRLAPAELAGPVFVEQGS